MVVVKNPNDEPPRNGGIVTAFVLDDPRDAKGYLRRSTRRH